MSTAIASFGKTFNGHPVKTKNSARVVHFVKEESKKTRILRVAKKVLFYGLLISLIAFIVAIAGFFYNYNYYSAIVERRINSGFWHSRAGVYSAPFVLKKDQKTNLTNVVELLRRSGYVEGNSAEDIWNGNFVVKGETVEISTKNYSSGQIETAAIELKNNRISAITDGKKSLDEYAIESELLTGRSETKRGKNHALKYVDIPENLRNAILTAEDRRFFEHRGIDPQGIFRALVANYQKGSIRQGGSTITQQLVKNTFLSPERSFTRKFSEAFLSLAL
jgi:penicillin-binding protein 1B